MSQPSIVLATSPAAERVVDDHDFQYHASKAAISQLVFSSVNFAKNQHAIHINTNLLDIITRNFKP